MGDQCRHEAINPLQVYFFSYILHYSCTGKPKCSYFVSCLGGSLAYKKMWNVAQIMSYSFCSYRSSYQGGAEPPHQEARGRGHRKNLFPPGCLHRFNPMQDIGNSTRACYHCNSKRLFWAEDACWWTPISGPVPEACSPNEMPLQGPFLGLKDVDIRTTGPTTLHCLFCFQSH
jgi:hypothetical protein